MKYKLTSNSIQINNVTLFQIQALIDIPSINVKAGDLGGFIQSEHNLSQTDNAWVSGNAQVFENAQIFENARVSGDAQIYDNAHVYGNAHISGYAQVLGNTQIFENARVSGDAQIYGYAKVSWYAHVSGNAKVYGYAQVYGYAKVSGNAQVYGNAQVCESAQIYGYAKVSGDAQVSGNAWVSGNAQVYGNAQVCENAQIYENARVSGDAQIYDNAHVSGNAQVYGYAIVAEDQRVTFSELTTDITNRQNIGDSIRVQCNLGICIDNLGQYVIGFKHVLKTEDPNVFKSKHDPKFIYEIGKVARADNPDLSNNSCSRGLHFSNISYWEGQKCDTVIMVRCYVKDIITVQEGKIRCKELDVIAVVENGKG